MEDLEKKIARLQEMVDECRHIVFMGGAGVSTESGVPDFRSEDGLYHQKFKYPPETMLSHSFYRSHRAEFYKFYDEKILVEGVEPNAAHLKLAEMEQAGKLSAVITQNIDGLHQKAGSKKVLELHGSVARNYCEKCHAFYDLDFMMEAKKNQDYEPRCTKECDGKICGGEIKPDVVLYEEGLDSDILNEAVRETSMADMLIIGGTSLVVYPAAGLVNYFRGKYLVVLNKSATPQDNHADLVISDSIGKVLSRIRV